MFTRKIGISIEKVKENVGYDRAIWRLSL